MIPHNQVDLSKFSSSLPVLHQSIQSIEGISHEPFSIHRYSLCIQRTWSGNKQSRPGPLPDEIFQFVNRISSFDQDRQRFWQVPHAWDLPCSLHPLYLHRWRSCGLSDDRCCSDSYSVGREAIERWQIVLITVILILLKECIRCECLCDSFCSFELY